MSRTRYNAIRIRSVHIESGRLPLINNFYARRRDIIYLSSNLPPKKKKPPPPSRRLFYIFVCAIATASDKINNPSQYGELFLGKKIGFFNRDKFEWLEINWAWNVFLSYLLSRIRDKHMLLQKKSKVLLQTHLDRSFVTQKCKRYDEKLKKKNSVRREVYSKSTHTHV